MEIRVCIDVVDLERAITFYTQGLGLRMGRRLGDGWAEMLGASSPIDLLAEKPDSAPLGAAHPQRRDYRRHWTPVHLDFVVGDVDAAAARVVAAGGKLEHAIHERKWGRMASMSDPFGHGLDLLEFRGRGYDEIVQKEE